MSDIRLKHLLISPPFGNYLGRSDCTSVLGSYTLDRRPGLVRQVAKTFRKVKGGWVNAIGLRNIGLRNFKLWHRESVYSLVGLEHGDWEAMLEVLPPDMMVELNLGCPNVHEYGIPGGVLRAFASRHFVIAKLPPTDKADAIADLAVTNGASMLHCSNTIPSVVGGISGRPLFEANLPIVARLAYRYPATSVIAGGGIYAPEQLRAYREAGATYFSLATVWMTPWRVPAIAREFHAGTSL